MKRFALLFSLILVCLIAPGIAFGQKGCELSVVGTWKVEGSDGSDNLLYRFGPDGTFTVLSRSGSGTNSQLREIASATYALDNPKGPKAISFTVIKEGGPLTRGMASMKIIRYDDTSFTCEKPGYGPARWVKIDPHRYFMVLVGQTEVFYDHSGPTFSMMIKTDGQNTQIDAVGIYSAGGRRAFGVIPPETYKEFMKEPHSGSAVMLRLEMTGAQYERSVKIVRTWERRAREGALLYLELPMNNILLAKQVAESLNQCGEKVKLHKLDWSFEDTISEGQQGSLIPFMYFKELRRLNEPLHVRDEEFYRKTAPGNNDLGGNLKQ
jgi:hypothetical protein